MRKIIFKTIVFLAFMFSFTQMTYAQNNESSILKEFEKARELYNKKMYISAKTILAEITSRLNGNQDIQRSQVEAYFALCAIELDDSSAPAIVESFVENYPLSPDVALVKFKLANKLFGKGEYSKAMTIYRNLESSKIYNSQVDQYLFEKGYSSMMMGNIPLAQTTFKKLIDRPMSNYTTAANYYYAYILYKNKDFLQSIPYFVKASEDSKFTTIAQYYIIESKLMLKDYDYVIENGPAVYDVIEDDFKTSLARIISDAYFVKDDMDNAKRYFDFYTSEVTHFSRKDNYYAGLLALSSKEYDKAVVSFRKSLSTDSLGQNAYYHLADSYLNLKNKLAACDAFKSASKLDYDPVIKEDAFFNYAKLSFDLNSDISPFNDYLALYPDSEKGDIIYNYIAKSYIQKRDFESAINALRRIKKPDNETVASLQRAAFFRGVEYVEMGSYRNAEGYFNVALDNYSDDLLHNMSYYWLAECYFRSGKYKESISILNRLYNMKELRKYEFYPMVIYNLGYSYFKSNNYGGSADWFEKFLEYEYADKAYLGDAKIRLADSYYMLKDYEKAGRMYEESSHNNPYSKFQSAISYGLTGNDQKKITLLQDLVKMGKQSGIYEQSIYELGRTFVQTGDDYNAEKSFVDLMETTSDSTYYARAMLEMGLMAANKGDYNGALARYRTIIEKYSMTSSSEDALSAMESIYQTQGNPEEFLAYLDRIGLSTFKSEDEKELMLFNAAEQKFLSGNLVAALNSFESFLKLYPKSSKASYANYYMAESFKDANRMEEAADHYYKVMELADEKLIEQASLNYAKISYDLARYDKAIEAYETLSYIAKLPENKNIATIGKMESYYAAKNYERAIQNAEKVLGIEEIESDSKSKRKAEYILAKSHLLLSEREKAKEYFKALAEDKNSPEGAEAAYFLIQDEYDNGNFEEVERLVYDFADSGSSQLYWLARCYIVLGDSFAERDDFDQAFATFQSIKESYTPVDGRDDILEQVELRLETINEMENEN